MANERGKSIDNTHLSIDQAEERGFLHRDYIAHCLRWTHVVNWLGKGQRYKTSVLMDIGCGVDLPLAKLLYSSRYIVEQYIGVDYNDAAKFKMDPFHTGKFPVQAYGNVDFANMDHVSMSIDDATTIEVCGERHPVPDVFVCFEMLEHIEPEHVRRVCQKVWNYMKLGQMAGKEPVWFVSTPNYDPHVGAAANHVNEMKHKALGYLFESLGFKIEARFGTFASQKDIKPVFLAEYPDGAEIFERLSHYYDSNYLATIFAPFYPELARNCIWRLRVPVPGEEYTRYYDLDGVEIRELTPWTSSAHWQDLLPQIDFNEP